MQDMMNWAGREDNALLSLFKPLDNQIHNSGQMQKWQIQNKTCID